MAQDFSTSLTRRSLVAAGLALSAAPVALAGADDAHAQVKENAKEFTSEKSLYERLGGVFAIAAVVDECEEGRQESHAHEPAEEDCKEKLAPLIAVIQASVLEAFSRTLVWA